MLGVACTECGVLAQVTNLLLSVDVINPPKYYSVFAIMIASPNKLTGWMRRVEVLWLSGKPGGGGLGEYLLLVVFDNMRGKERWEILFGWVDVPHFLCTIIIYNLFTDHNTPLSPPPLHQQVRRTHITLHQYLAHFFSAWHFWSRRIGVQAQSQSQCHIALTN